jgi:hypothetical protein
MRTAPELWARLPWSPSVSGKDLEIMLIHSVMLDLYKYRREPAALFQCHCLFHPACQLQDEALSTLQCAVREHSTSWKLSPQTQCL